MDVMENNTALEAEDQDESLVLKFRNPYQFEGKQYEELDLSGLEDITAAMLVTVGKLMAKSGVITPMPEMSMDYALILAAKVTNMPMEFFHNLPARETIRLKNIVTGFLYGGDGDN